MPSARGRMIRTGLKHILLAALAWASTVTSANEPNAPALHRDLHGAAKFRYDYFWVDQDKGRFREDQWRPDAASGGLERLELRSQGPDEHGYAWHMQGRALYEHDYAFSLFMQKENSHYLLLDLSRWRRYTDGSNEAWNASVPGLAEKSDSDFFTDRDTYNIEFGLTPEAGPSFILGWHRLIKDGQEVLLRGADGVSTGGPTVSSVPIVAHMRGITDTLYAEAARTWEERHSIRVRQEFEQYRDNQRLNTSSYDINGGIDHADLVDDDLGYTNWRSLLMFDSRLNEENYVTANYMYNYLNNDSTRDNVGYHEVTTHRGGNSRKTHVGALAYQGDHIANIDHLSLVAGVRVEDTQTQGHMAGSSKYYNFLTGQYVGPKPRMVSSSLDEVPVAETVKLTYRGLERTTLSAAADLEQRALRWSERDQHGGVLSDPDLSRKTDITISDQVYTFKAVRRFKRSIKTTAKLRIKDLERNYTELRDDTPFYPGYLDDYRLSGTDLSLGLDCRLGNSATATLQYLLMQEDIHTALAGETQQRDIHQGAGSLSFSPTQNMFLVGTFMLEHYRLDTPARGAAANHAQGTRPFDFEGDAYSLLLDGTYHFNEKTACTFGLQHTEALGTVDFAGDYSFDSIEVMWKFKCSPDQILGLGYRYINFDDHHGGFDDYSAHGLALSYEFFF